MLLVGEKVKATDTDPWQILWPILEMTFATGQKCETVYRDHISAIRTRRERGRRGRRMSTPCSDELFASSRDVEYGGKCDRTHNASYSGEGKKRSKPNTVFRDHISENWTRRERRSRPSILS